MEGGFVCSEAVLQSYTFTDSVSCMKGSECLCGSHR